MDDNNLSFKIILGNPEIFIPKISILKLFLISEISVFPVFRSDDGKFGILPPPHTDNSLKKPFLSDRYS